MASPTSGTSSGSGSGSSLLLHQNSVSDGDFQQLMEQRKRRRMESNRESARRSRVKKQRHVDDLTVEVDRMRRENNRIITSLGATTQLCSRIEGENSILRAQVGELSHRLESLNQIISLLDGGETGGNGGFATEEPCFGGNHEYVDGFGFVNNPWNYVYQNQPIMASAAEMLQY